jgi:hypothetical protein
MDTTPSGSPVAERIDRLGIIDINKAAVLGMDLPAYKLWRAKHLSHVEIVDHDGVVAMQLDFGADQLVIFVDGIGFDKRRRILCQSAETLRRIPLHRLDHRVTLAEVLVPGVEAKHPDNGDDHGAGQPDQKRSLPILWRLHESIT